MLMYGSQYTDLIMLANNKVHLPQLLSMAMEMSRRLLMTVVHCAPLEDSFDELLSSVENTLTSVLSLAVGEEL